jgi:hypothetical protein
MENSVFPFDATAKGLSSSTSGNLQAAGGGVPVHAQLFCGDISWAELVKVLKPL